MMLSDVTPRAERLTIEQIRKVAHCVRTRETHDPKTATAVANALESVARHRATRILRARMRVRLHPFGPLRRVATWAMTKALV